MDRIDRMGIRRSDDVTDNERYGSLYLIKQRHNNVNDYGGAVGDVEKLSAITNAAAGSTCLFTNGDIYRLELDGWAKFGAAEDNAEQAASLNLSPLNINRSELDLGLTGDEDIEPTIEPMPTAER